MIEYIKIERFKSIKKMELELRPINILVGGNGDGKSNFISFFKLLNAVFTRKLQRFVAAEGVDNLLHYGRKNTEALSAELIFSEKSLEEDNSYDFTLTINKIGGLFIEHEVSGFRNSCDDDAHHTFYKHNLKESHFARATQRRYKLFQKQIPFAHIYHFHDTSSTSWLRRGCDLNDNLLLRPDGGNLSAFLYFLKHHHPIIFNRIQQTIQSIMPHLSEMILEPLTLPEGQKKIELRWIDRGDPYSSFSGYQLSDGTLRFIALTTLLLQPSPPPIAIIDEPELGLHPMALAKLAGMIRVAASNNTQVIVATQSGSLIGHFVPEDIVVIDRSISGNHTVFGRPDAESLRPWLDDETLGDLWERGIIDTSLPFFRL